MKWHAEEKLCKSFLHSYHSAVSRRPFKYKMWICIPLNLHCIVVNASKFRSKTAKLFANNSAIPTRWQSEQARRTMAEETAFLTRNSKNNFSLTELSDIFVYAFRRKHKNLGESKTAEHLYSITPAFPHKPSAGTNNRNCLLETILVS